MSSFLIAGCGYVGGRLAELLAGAGHAVTVLRRGTAPQVPGVEALRADLLDPASLRDLPRTLDGAVFAAGPSSPDETGYRGVFVDGLRHLIAALLRQDVPPRLLFTSSTAVYGQSGGEWVDETSPTEPPRFNGRILLEAESLLRCAPLPGSVLRLGGIYGPGRTRLVERVRQGAARLHPGPERYTNRIHREDAAGALAHLLTAERVDPLYLGVDHDPAGEGEVLRFLAREMGLPAPLQPAGDAPVPSRLAGSKRCRNDRLVASGYRFVYPSYRDGYAALLREL